MPQVAADYPLTLQLVGMASPLIDTKFYAPRRRSEIVPRPLLNERLDRGARTKLTLVSAPAGFGKSTLVAEWLPAASAADPSWPGSHSMRATTTPSRSGHM